MTTRKTFSGLADLKSLWLDFDARGEKSEYHCHQLEKAYHGFMQTEPSEKGFIAVTVKVPACVAGQFGLDSESITRRLLEQAAAEGYRSKQLSRGQVGQTLGLDWAETEEFLANHECERHYDLEDLERDRRNLDTILGHA